MHLPHVFSSPFCTILEIIKYLMSNMILTQRNLKTKIMKTNKIFLMYLVVISFFVSLTLVKFSYGQTDEIEWGVEEGDSYTWVVKTSNESLGFSPVGTKFEINITSIRSMLNGNATELNATITIYTSTGAVAGVRLNNERFIYFDHTQKKNFAFYAPIYDHCFFAPKNYATNFADGIMYYSDNYGNMVCAPYVSHGKLTSIYGYPPSGLFNMWEFSNYIGHKLLVSYPGEYDEGIYQYVLELEGSGGAPAISYGNFFLVFTSLAILSLIYISKNKLVKK